MRNIERFEQGKPFELPSSARGRYCFTISRIATVFSLLSPWSLTASCPVFSSTLTTVASEIPPLVVTFTLSPALSCGVADGLATGDGLWTGAGGTWPFAGLFAFELVSVGAGSQAAMLKDKSNTAKNILVIILSPVRN